MTQEEDVREKPMPGGEVGAGIDKYPERFRTSDGIGVLSE